jgi:hypothetical protein
VFVEVVACVDVEVAHLVVLGCLGWNGIEQGPAEELELDEFRVAEGEEPALAFVAVERVFDRA